MENTTPSAAPGAPLISLHGVEKHYGAVQAVRGVDLSINGGELFGLIGHNGAGKSTLFKMMLGLIHPSAGTLCINGAPVGGRGFRAVRRMIGYLPENVVLYDNLTGLEVLCFFADLKGVERSDCPRVLARVGLGQAGNRRVREYSKGMRQRLGFAQALLGKPRLLFLDEPTNGLDPEGIRDFYQLLGELRAEGTTVILTSHLLAEIQERVDRLAIMASGRLQAVGSVQSLRDAMELPVQLSVHLRPADLPRAQALLATLPCETLRQHADGDDAVLSLRCPRADKLAVVGALLGLGDAITDLRVQEPSLEDVFFGYRE